MQVARTSSETGDTVEVSVTHEIKISGDKTWVGTRITSKVRDNETTEDAHARVNDQVQASVMKSIESTVATVKEYTQ